MILDIDEDAICGNIRIQSYFRMALRELERVLQQITDCRGEHLGIRVDQNIFIDRRHLNFSCAAHRETRRLRLIQISARRMGCRRGGRFAVTRTSASERSMRWRIATRLRSSTAPVAPEIPTLPALMALMARLAVWRWSRSS